MSTLPILAVLGGLVLLVAGADRFVTGAAALARNLGVAPMVVGLTIVGFGTSAPEMLVSGIAAWQGNPGLGIGNALGSNVTNIALIIGATAVLRPLRVRSLTLRRELPVLMAVTLAALALMADGHLGRLDGALLMGGLALLLYAVLLLARRDRRDPLAAEFAAEMPAAMPTGRALLWLAAGLAGLLIGSRVLVWGAVALAQALGVSDLVIGLTVVAVGTSLPELAASVAGALKGEDDIAVGNVIGSNMFNLLAVLGLPGLIRPAPFEPAVLTRDFPVLIALTIALFAMAYGFRGEGRINRWEGLLLLAAFVAYDYTLYAGG